MKKIVYFCDWLPPDFGAVGQYSLQFARQHAANGNEVTLFGLSSTDDSVTWETMGTTNLGIFRVHSRIYERAALSRRLLWTATTNWRLLRRAWSYLRAADTVIFTGSPPFLVHFLAPLNWFLRKALVYRMTDFYPECIIAAKPTLRPWLYPLLSLTNFWRRRVGTLEVIGDDQKERLLGYGIPSERIAVVRDLSPVAFSGSEPKIGRPRTASPGPLLLYSGNLGVAHDWQTFADAYVSHQAGGKPSVNLWLNATGSGADLLEQSLKSRGAPLHRSGLVPLAELSSLLVSVDAHLITLKDEFVGYVLPSKVYACIDSKRPILYIGSKKSDVYRLCLRGLAADRFFHAEVGDHRRVAEHLESLRKLYPTSST